MSSPEGTAGLFGASGALRAASGALRAFGAAAFGLAERAAVSVAAKPSQLDVPGRFGTWFCDLRLWSLLMGRFFPLLPNPRHHAVQRRYVVPSLHCANRGACQKLKNVEQMQCLVWFMCSCVADHDQSMQSGPINSRAW